MKIQGYTTVNFSSKETEEKFRKKNEKKCIGGNVFDTFHINSKRQDFIIESFIEGNLRNLSEISLSLKE